MKISLNLNHIDTNNIKIPLEKTLLQLLQIGDSFEGEVIDIRKDFMLISINNNEILEAKILDNVELLIGQKLMFQVQDKKEDQIIIKPLIQSFNTPEDNKIINALEQAQVPINEKNIEIVKALIHNQMPINKESLQKHILLGNTYKEFAANDVIIFSKNDIPVSKEQLLQLQQYKLKEHQLISKIDTLIENVINKLEGLSEDNQHSKVNIIHKHLQNIINNSNTVNNKDITNNIIIEKDNSNIKYSSQNSNNSSYNNRSNHNSLELLSKNKTEIINNFLSKTDNFINIESLKNGKITFKQLFDYIDSLPQKESKKLLEILIKSDNYKDLLKNELLKEFTLTPSTIEKEQIEKLYNTIEKQVKNIEDIVKTTEFNQGKNIENMDSVIQEVNNSIKQNIDFLKLINQTFQYVQIPLKIKNQNIHSELFVFNNKKELKNNSKNITALLHLDLVQLGELDIYINKQDRKIFSQIFSDSKETQQLITSNQNELINQLGKKGYNLQVEIKPHKKAFDFIDDFINKKDTKTSIKRFSFDIRV